LVAEVQKLTRTMKEFDEVRPVLAARMDAVLAAERALIAAPPAGKSAALQVLTDAVVLMLSTKGTQTIKEAGGTRVVETKIPKLTGREDPRSVSTSHYEVHVGSLTLTGTAASISGEFDEQVAEGEGETAQVAGHQVGMPISLVTLRASDYEVMAGPGTAQKRKFGQVPDHWRGHDSELKLLEEIAFRLRPHLVLPKNDFAPSAVKSPEVTGNVWVHSDFVICPSCLNAIWNFTNRFPNVKLVVTSSSRLTPAGARRMMN
jgi:hypothetical protein